jgi:DNA-binding transcriptional MerR regulator
MQARQTTYAIGRLSELSGVPVKTIRFYSDTGLVPPSGRSEAGHRRYTEADLARLQLVRSLREVGLDLPTIQALLDGHGELGDVLGAHVATLEARIRALRRQLVVLRAASASPTEATLRRLSTLVRLDAIERRALLDHFWDRVLDPDHVAGEVAATFREFGTPDLPDDATPEQLDAWLELAELAADEDFAATTRRNATWIPEAVGRPVEAGEVMDAAAEGLTVAVELMSRGVSPSDPEADVAVEAFVRPYARVFRRRDGRPFRRWLLEQVDEHTDPRAARWWELVATVRGDPPEPEEVGRHRRAYGWLIDALRARLVGSRR